MLHAIHIIAILVCLLYCVYCIVQAIWERMFPDTSKKTKVPDKLTRRINFVIAMRKAEKVVGMVKNLPRRVFKVMTGIEFDLVDWKLCIAWLLLVLLTIALFWLVVFHLDNTETHLWVKDRIQVIVGVHFIVAGSYLVWLSFKYSKAGRIARVLRAYIFGAFVFSGLYFFFYYQNPASFSFASGISTSAELQRFQALSDDLSKHYRKIIAASRFFAWTERMSESDFERFKNTRTQTVWPVDKNIRVTLSYRAVPAGEMPVMEYGVMFEDPEGTLYTWGGQVTGELNPMSWHFSPQYLLVDEANISKDEYLRAILALKKEFEDDTNPLYQEMSLQERRAFNLLDFIYFSFVTVTTLGYGDMVPKASWIRILIVGQILFGLSLILSVSQERDPAPLINAHPNSNIRRNRKGKATRRRD